VNCQFHTSTRVFVLVFGRYLDSKLPSRCSPSDDDDDVWFVGHDEAEHAGVSDVCREQSGWVKYSVDRLCCSLAGCCQSSCHQAQTLHRSDVLARHRRPYLLCSAGDKSLSTFRDGFATGMTGYVPVGHYKTQKTRLVIKQLTLSKKISK